MIVKVLTRLVSCLVAISEIAKAKAANSTSSAVGWKLASPGRTITTTPRKPSTTLPSRLLVMRSPSTSAASSATQAGVVNSSANTVANGKERHRQRPAVLADEVRGVAREVEFHVARRGLGAQVRARHKQRHEHDETRARSDRQDLEDVELLAKRADRQRAHRERDQRAGHPCGDPADVRAGHDYSASGWFSGRALSKAGSFSRRRRPRRASGTRRAAPSAGARCRSAARDRCRRA